MLKALKVLIVEEDATIRGRLIDALKAVVLTVKVDFTTNIKAALQKLSGLNSYDAVIIRSQKSIEPVCKVVEACNKSRDGPPPRVLVALRGADQASSAVAELYLAGAHGILCEPFSSEKLLELITTAQEQSQIELSLEKKASLAAGFLTADALKLIDLIADDKIAGRDPAYHLHDLKKVGRGLSEVLSKIDPETFLKLITAKLKDAKPSGRVPVEKKDRSKVIKPARHPGLIVKEALNARGITPERLLSIISIKSEDLTLLLEEKAPITEDIAREISRALGKTAKYWLKLQSDFDSYQEFLSKNKGA